MPVVTVSTNSTTIGSTTTNAGLSGLTAGTSYTLTADASSVKGIDGESVSSGDYTFYWQKVSGGNTVTVATGNTYSFTAVNGDAYRLLVEARNNMKVGASSHLVSVNALSTVTVTLDTSYTFLGGSDASTQNVSTNRINGSHVGDAITLTASVTGTTTLPTGTVDFYYISNSTTVKLARVSLAEWDTNVATASYTLSGTRLGEGVYTFYAVYNGSTTYTSTSYNSQNGGSNDPSVKPYRVWSVTINDCTLSTNPTVSNAKLTAGSTYTFVMGAVYTTDGELLDLGTDYDIPKRCIKRYRTYC